MAQSPEDKIPVRALPARYINDPLLRGAVEKMRGNALIIAIQKLGGELVITPGDLVKARGLGVVAKFDGPGHYTFKVVEAQRQ
jgi:hypothetical protein